MKRTTNTNPAPKFDTAPWAALDNAKMAPRWERATRLEAVASKARKLSMSPRDHEAFWRQWNDAMCA